MSHIVRDPWLVAGDFNNFNNQEEKRNFPINQARNQNLSQRRYMKFSQQIGNCSLIDIGCVEPRLTWTNNRQGWSNTMVRLDKALCNMEWRTLFSNGTFEAAWISHEGFRSAVENNWNVPHLSFSDGLKSKADKAIDWNKLVFGNIFRCKRWFLGRIEGIQKSQALNYSHNLHMLELDLISQYNRILHQKVIHWFQKSKTDWISQGDRNTKFFHVTTLIKRKRIRIEILKDEQGNWIDQPRELKCLIHNYFVNLFSPCNPTQLRHWKGLANCTISSEDNSELLRNVTKEEVWKAIKNIKAFKAPSIDGLQVIFYHTY
ncbi:uncharacterized protein LOC114260109 [Camellia sinensis]|uniref:uncharacterized protein LOC114260109 n=1 Tax=Camellia sinensis TaxID=4442 RepID=UPI00103600A4|nr:uncharacterized protein LOC114260109 [Camellia sinensis]